ncbi:MAG: hypothetical protein RBT71_11905 [Flavobacteriales bacterium]|jgi:outer membrane protein assembly factor BamA|nr:hypothetical protein [Flavobacteriales bacterium]
MMRARLPATIGALALCLSTAAQPGHHLHFIVDGELPAKWTRPVKVASPAEVPEELRRFMALLHAEGYLAATVDTCITTEERTTCHVAPGTPYRWARLSGAGIPPEIATEARFREKLYGGRPIVPAQVARLMEGLLQHSENHGHPFAQVRLDSLRADGDGVHAIVRLDRGPLVTFDSVVVRGTARTNLRYLHAHIGIRPGDPYNEKLIVDLERRTKELPFVAQKQRPYVQFTPESTKLYLFLDARKASSINGILGVQPDELTGQVKLTGDLDLRLRNALRRGEGIHLNWRSLADRTQDLRVGFDLPFAFRTPFGVDASLKIFRRDTSFLEVNMRGGIDYLMARGDKVQFFVQNRTNARLGSNLVATPGMADVKLVSYGLGLRRERFDYRLNPRQGHSIEMEASAGRKRTTTAVIGPEDPAPEVRSLLYELRGKAVLHLPLARRSTVRLAGQGGRMVNDDLYRNELYRVGGLQTLRGIDEGVLYASAYAVGTVEYRFIYEENANFFAFADQGWWEDRTTDGDEDRPVTDSPLGFGVGTTLETKAGLFSITYALGRQFSNPIVLRGGKVHFGFVSLF